MEIIILFLIIIILYLLFIGQKANKKLSSQEKSFNQYKSQSESNLKMSELKIENCKSDFESYKSEMEYLKKYIPIKDAEAEVKSIEIENKKQIDKVNQESKDIILEAKRQAKDIKVKAEEKLNQSQEIASKVEKDALIKAEKIAGEAWKAKENADQYKETVKAMKNIIKGYGDEYLIPNESLLDELAEEYNHTAAGQDLANIRVLIKKMVKNNEVADCDYVEQHRKTTAIEFVIDAFNGKVDSIMSKVKHDNFGILNQKIKDAFRIVNHNGKPFRNARILARYFDAIIQQLKLSVTVHELKKKDQEEQRTIREAIREEEKARREYEKALKQSEKEEKMIAKALKEAEAKLKGAALEEKAKYEMQLNNLLEELKVAQEKGQRALSMAQQTKRGHVYVISNVGSFGENIFKIGLTRRLNPLDRVKELGDASVPFSFDIHAIIFSEDAPNLEKELHKTFKQNQVNKVNPRKEFFNIPLSDIKNQVTKMDLNTHWTMKAEAMEYRESVQLSKEKIIT